MLDRGSRQTRPDSGAPCRDPARLTTAVVHKITATIASAPRLAPRSAVIARAIPVTLPSGAEAVAAEAALTLASSAVVDVATLTLVAATAVSLT